MNSAAPFIPRIWTSNRRFLSSASASLEHSSPEPARLRRGSADADSPLTRSITAGTLHTRWG